MNGAAPAAASLKGDTTSSAAYSASTSSPLQHFVQVPYNRYRTRYQVRGGESDVEFVNLYPNLKENRV